MKFQFLDLPHLFSNTQIGYDFIKVFEQRDCYSQSTKVILDHHDKFWRKKYHFWLGIPTLVNIMTYLYYSFFVLPALFDGD